MQKAAKEKTFILWIVASVALFCAPSFASSVRDLPAENRVEIFLPEGQNRTVQQAFDTANRVENYDSAWGVASESSVAPKGTLTPRAARRQAMREHGIPTSQQPVGQSSVHAPDGTPAGRQYDYELPSPYGGPPQKHSVQHSLTDDVPGHGPHFEAGQTKALGQLDSLGRPRIRNPKVKVNE